MISRRHLHLLIALVLPLMVMRGMLPAGYMAAAEDGKLRIVMCSAGLAPAGDSGSGPDGGDPLPGDAGSCLFAHAASVAPPTAGGWWVPVAEPDLLPLTSSPASTLPQATGPPRLAAARAPPAFLV